jgi:hypothetical protein
MVQDEYICLRCGEKLIARRCKIQCPRCGYTEDCADAGLIDYERKNHYQRGSNTSNDSNDREPNVSTSRRYTSNSG